MKKRMTKHSFFSLAYMPVLALCLTGCIGLQPGGGTHEDKITVTKLVSSTNSWDGAVLPAYPSQQPNVTILRIRIPPGARLHTHRHPVINAGVLLSGELTVRIPSGPTLHLVAGDPIIEVVNTFHYGVNEGKTPAEIIVFYAGTLDDPTSIIEK
jgi:quercetin dioxygenase-like cupin family protein